MCISNGAMNSKNLFGRGKLDIDESIYTEVPSPPNPGAAADGRPPPPPPPGDLNRRIAAVMRDTSLTPQERQSIIQDLRTGTGAATGGTNTSCDASRSEPPLVSPRHPLPSQEDPRLQPAQPGGGGGVRSDLVEMQSLQERESAAARAAEERRLESLHKRGFRGFETDRHRASLPPPPAAPAFFFC